MSNLAEPKPELKRRLLPSIDWMWDRIEVFGYIENGFYVIRVCYRSDRCRHESEEIAEDANEFRSQRDVELEAAKEALTAIRPLIDKDRNR